MNMPSHASEPSAPAFLSAQRIRRLRLLSGLTMTVFVCTHFINHGLGLISVEVMEAARRLLHVPIWQSLIGKAALFSALVTHFLLSLLALYRRSSLKMPMWEAAQLGFGFAIPLLLVGHIVGSQIAPGILEFDINYPHSLDMIWADSWLRTKQITLIVVVWVHAMIGLHFWLRLKPWYRQWLPLFYGLAIVVPLLAILGFIRAALEVQAMLSGPDVDPAFYALVHAGMNGVSEAQSTKLALVGQSAPLIILAFILLTLFARQIKLWMQNRRPGFIIHHPLAGKINGLTGQSVLEALRAAGVPHASVCGGRARCTTCRISIDREQGSLASPTDMEAAALKRINADSSVRLACQVRPQSDVWVTPLLPPKIGPTDYQGEGGISGVEQEVVAMFLDLRGFSSFAESRLPFDVVLVLNQFFGHMSAALASTRGHYAQFTGDGLFALFGLQGDIRQACRDALSSAVEMQHRLDSLNQYIQSELETPLKIGIGIHCGEAIVGPMGPPDARVISAIGDPVNVASRLEGATKQFSCIAMVSCETIRRAELTLDGVAVEEIEIRGRKQGLAVYPIYDIATLDFSSVNNSEKSG